MISVGTAVIFGADPKWRHARITNLPPDLIRVRLRFRADSVATAVVQTSDSFTRYVLVPDGTFSSGKIKLGWPIGFNLTKV